MEGLEFVKACRAAKLRKLHAIISQISDNDRLPNKQRKRLDWDEHLNNIGAALFKRAYRLPIEEFKKLLEKIRPHIESNQIKAQNSSGSAISSEIKLATISRRRAVHRYLLLPRY
ncbi:MAG: hypothetical protein ACREBR_02875 [bacterium]